MSIDTSRGAGYHLVSVSLQYWFFLSPPTTLTDFLRVCGRYLILLFTHRFCARGLLILNFFVLFCFFTNTSIIYLEQNFLGLLSFFQVCGLFILSRILFLLYNIAKKPSFFELQQCQCRWSRMLRVFSFTQQPDTVKGLWMSYGISSWGLSSVALVTFLPQVLLTERFLRTGWKSSNLKFWWVFH